MILPSPRNIARMNADAMSNADIFTVTPVPIEDEQGPGALRRI